MIKKKFVLIATIIGIIALMVFGIYFIWFRSIPALMLYANVDIRELNLAFRVSGRLLSLKVDEGDTVHKGDLIARLDPEPYILSVNVAHALIKQQKAMRAYAESTCAREKTLYLKGVSSIDRYQNALTARDASEAGLEKAIADLAESNLNLQDTYLYAPSAGMVLTRVLEPGSMLAAGNAVISLSLVDPVWVRAYVAETDLGRAKSGTKVEVYSDSNPAEAFSGIIGFVSPNAEFTPKTVETTQLRTQLVYRLRIVMQDPLHKMRQGMPVTVRVLD